MAYSETTVPNSYATSKSRYSTQTTPSYPWQRPYEAAILSTDRSQLPALIEAAQATIAKRIAEIQTAKNGTPDEMQAIEGARNGLRILIAETRSQ